VSISAYRQAAKTERPDSQSPICIRLEVRSVHVRAMRRLPDAGAGPRIGIEGRSVLDAQVARVSSDVEDELPKELTF
jgi:hypothetical protein